LAQISIKQTDLRRRDREANAMSNMALKNGKGRTTINEHVYSPEGRTDRQAGRQADRQTN